MAEPDVKAAVDALKNDEVSEDITTEEVSEVEQEAIDLGWNPDGAEGKRNLSPEEFIERQSFYDEIKGLKSQLKKTSSVVNALKTHNDTVADRSYKKAIQDLKDQKKVAAADEDISTVLAIDEQIDAVKEDYEDNKANSASEDTAGKEVWDEAFSDFTTANIWYGRVPDMTQRADFLGRAYMQSAEAPSPDECYKYVMKSMQTEFPDEFGSITPVRRKAKAKVASPQSGGKVPARSKKHSLNDLDTVTRKVADTLISSGTITEEKYLKDYFTE